MRVFTFKNGFEIDVDSIVAMSPVKEFKQFATYSKDEKPYEYSKVYLNCHAIPYVIEVFFPYEYLDPNPDFEGFKQEVENLRSLWKSKDETKTLNEK